MRNILFLCLLLFSSTFLPAQNKDLFEKQLFIQGEDTLRCRILTPINFSTSKKYPLIVFLHGSGERGNDNEKQLIWGAEFFLDSISRSNYPAIVVFPQCPENVSWSNNLRTNVKDSLGGFKADTLAPLKKPANLVLQFIDTLLAHGSIDKHRVYLGGLSMGGFGTFELLWRRPDLFAAAFPICGGGSPEKTSKYASKLPIWVFHGDSDPVVPVGNSRLMVKALQSTGAKVKYTEYPGVSHDSWKNAFLEPDLMSWIFSQRKK
jgi:predicted peptidase